MKIALNHILTFFLLKFLKNEKAYLIYLLYAARDLP